jgi:hypothetical protein
MNTILNAINTRAAASAAAIISVACALFATGSWAQDQAVEPKAKTLATAVDPTKKAVTIGRAVTANMDFELSLEAAEPMWMQMGTPPM